jgi:hypothetical protein
VVDDDVPDEAAAEEDVVGEHGSRTAHEYIRERRCESNRMKTHTLVSAKMEMMINSTPPSVRPDVGRRTNLLHRP